VAKAVGWKDGELWRTAGTLERYRDVALALERASRVGAVSRAPHLASALRVLADELLARGLVELAYATALGQPDRAWISADEAAIGHDFGLRAVGTQRRELAWRFPIAGADSRRDWRALGSLLGLDVTLAELSLVRLSSKPPPRRPTLNEEERRVFIENVALVEPSALTDAGLDTMLGALRKGRARVDAVRTPVDAAAIADEIRLSPARRSLLAWMVTHEPARIGAFLSPTEILLVGLEHVPLDARWHAWGAPAESRLGCLCLRLFDRPWETLAGRWGTGIFASGFADLNIRLAELLASMQMPASLLGPVLSSATLDFVNSASARGQDDRRALVEFVQALKADRVEQYLALLTTEGPLVPTSAAEDGAASRTGVPR
jgi:hypothetical protein